MARRRRETPGRRPRDRGTARVRGPKTLFEVSAGGVVYRRGPDGIEVCLIATKGGTRWQLPKGKQEEGEALEETAVREVAEETGLATRGGPRLDTLDLWYTWRDSGVPVRHHKHVHFYLLEYVSGSTDDHDDEVDEARWFAVEEALERLTFPSEVRVVERALTLLGAKPTPGVACGGPR